MAEMAARELVCNRRESSLLKTDMTHGYIGPSNSPI